MIIIDNMAKRYGKTILIEAAWKNLKCQKCEEVKKENEQLRKEHQEMLEKYLLLKLKIGEVLNDE